MIRHFRAATRLSASVIFVFILGTSTRSTAQSNIDATNMHAWGENVGWTDWRDAAGGAAGVSVGGHFLWGFIWAENVGWINLGNGTPINGVNYHNTTGGDAGVNVAPNGMLSGLAWGENIGWILFGAGSQDTPQQRAYLSCDGRLHGFAWSENVGWINLSLTQTGQFVQVDTQTRPGQCDVDHNGVVDGRDVQAFVNLIVLGGATWSDLCAGDLGAPRNGVIDAGDVAAFVACLVNG